MNKIAVEKKINLYLDALNNIFTVGKNRVNVLKIKNRFAYNVIDSVLCKYVRLSGTIKPCVDTRYLL